MRALLPSRRNLLRCTAACRRRRETMRNAGVPLRRVLSPACDLRATGRQIARVGRGRVVRYGDLRGRGAEIHQPRAHVFRRHSRSGADRIYAGAPFRNGRTAVARAQTCSSHDPVEAALFGLFDDHARALGSPRDADRHGNLLRNSRVVPP